MVDDGRRLHEKEPGRRPPLLKIGRFTEADHMILDAIPSDAQDMWAGPFDHAFERHRAATRSVAEEIGTTCNGGLKLAARAGSIMMSAIS